MCHYWIEWNLLHRLNVCYFSGWLTENTNLVKSISLNLNIDWQLLWDFSISNIPKKLSDKYNSSKIVIFMLLQLLKCCYTNEVQSIEIIGFVCAVIYFWYENLSHLVNQWNFHCENHLTIVYKLLPIVFKISYNLTKLASQSILNVTHWQRERESTSWS